MSQSAAGNDAIVIVGGGLSGTLCALHLLAIRPDRQITIIERGNRLGPGLAYGACSEEHLLNVPANRLTIGAPVSFESWMNAHAEIAPRIADAMARSSGKLGDAFVPRAIFGAYLEEQAQILLKAGKLVWRRGEAVAFLDLPKRGILLNDGREVAGDKVILALGNLPSKSPAPVNSGLEDLEGYIPDPWAAAALAKIRPDDSVMVAGTGLTMVDIVLSLRARGHAGSMVAVSRRGLPPSRHAAGGQWPAFLTAAEPMSPANLLGMVRRQVRLAEQQGIPWQRVIDAIRPFVARIWREWTLAERARFLRHLRPRWEVVRHRMPPALADRLEALMKGGGMEIIAGRLGDCREIDGGVEINIVRAAGVKTPLRARWIINCTGPRSDFGAVGAPLVADARRRGLILPDSLGLGIETRECAAVSTGGASSDWLFAVGALTRPAWWEITAAPEINAQAHDLAAALSAPRAISSSLADRFLDLGAGI